MEVEKEGGKEVQEEEIIVDSRLIHAMIDIDSVFRSSLLVNRVISDKEKGRVIPGGANINGNGPDEQLSCAAKE